MRRSNSALFARKRELREASDMSPARKLLYPLVYGGRPRFRFEPYVKQGLERVGVWRGPR